MPKRNAPKLTCTWERSAVSVDGDRALLMIRVRTDRTSPDAVKAPVDVAFALDRSGSMTGRPIELVKEAVVVATASLRPDDRMSLVVYDNDIDVLQPLQPVSGTTRADVRRLLDGVDARGSTNLCDGWLTACQQLAGSPVLPVYAQGRLRRSLLLTDGLANIGTTSHGELIEHATQLRKRGIATSTLGVGDEFDEVLLAGMAEAGGGNFQFIPSPSQLPAYFQRELGELLSIVATGLRIRLTFPTGVRAELISSFPCERTGKTLVVDLGDIPEQEDLALILSIETPVASPDSHVSVAASAGWSWPGLTEEGTLDLAIEPLTCVENTSSRLLEREASVTEQAVLQTAARDQREAMRLDREGRYAESRLMHSQAHSTLLRAPQTPLVTSRVQEAVEFASYAPSAAMPESVRKQSVHQTLRRGRGRSDDR